MEKLLSKICLQCRVEYCGRGKKFCSRSCNVTYNNLHNNVAKRPEVRKKLSAIAKASGRQAQLMTPSARKKAIIGISKAMKGRKLSIEHKKAISRGVKKAGCIPPKNAHLVGTNHWNWQGGLSTIRNKAFNSKEYKEFRDNVLLRDNYTCQECGHRGGKLHVHHIKPWGPFPSVRYDVSNGVTLCPPCHYLKHRNTPRPSTAGPHILADLG